MNKLLVISAAVIALIGLIANVSFDRDNPFDMFAAGWWLLTFIVALLGAFLGKEAKPQPPSQPPKQ